MFGIYRFVLALMVIFSHLSQARIYWTGFYAVFCFYQLSGYLMTLILNERYGFHIDGIKHYAVNRALRIYPPYLTVFLLSLVIIILIPSAAKHINSALIMPSGIIEWFHNIIIFGLSGDRGRLVPSAWSIDVELTLYLAMPFILARNKKMCFFWFVFSVVGTCLMVITYQPFDLRYSSIAGALLPFSIGSMLYYYRYNLPILSKGSIAASIIFFTLHTMFSDVLWIEPKGIGLYVTIILGTYLQLSLISINLSELPEWLKQLDKRLGNLSYPIFLCHWHVAAILVYIGLPRKSLVLFFMGTIVSILTGIIINRFIENPIEKIRNRVKSGIVKKNNLPHDKNKLAIEQVY